MCGLHQTLPLIKKSNKCSKCLRLSYIENTCPTPQRCVRCGEDHGREKCATDQTLYVNFERGQESTSCLCPSFNTNEAIYTYRSEKHSDLREQCSLATTQPGLVPNVEHLTRYSIMSGWMPGERNRGTFFKMFRNLALHNETKQLSC